MCCDTSTNVIAQLKAVHTRVDRVGCNGHAAVVRLLLRAGADPGARKLSGQTALHAASWRGTADVVLLLVGGGVDVNLADSSGWTPLHSASWRPNPGVMEALIQNGAEVDCKTSAGITPLHVAASEGHIGAVSLLITSGAAVNMTDSEGRTPWDVARNDVIRSQLERAGGVGGKDSAHSKPQQDSPRGFLDMLGLGGLGCCGARNESHPSKNSTGCGITLCTDQEPPH